MAVIHPAPSSRRLRLLRSPVVARSIVGIVAVLLLLALLQRPARTEAIREPLDIAPLAASSDPAVAASEPAATSTATTRRGFKSAPTPLKDIRRHRDGRLPRRGLWNELCGPTASSAPWAEPPLPVERPCGLFKGQPVSPGPLGSVTLGGPVCFGRDGSPPKVSVESGSEMDTAAAEQYLSGLLETGPHFADALDPLWAWLRRTTATGSTAAPRCTGHVAVVVPVVRKASNPMHALHRAWSARRLVDSLASEHGAGSVTVVYAVLDEGAAEASVMNAHAVFAPLVSRHWTAIEVSNASAAAVTAVVAAGGAGELCFPEAHVLRFASAGGPGGWTATDALFTWNGERSERDLADARAFRGAFLEAYRDPHTPWPHKADAARPKIVIAVRTRSRKFLRSDAVLPEVSKFAKAVLGARAVVIVEHTGTSANDIADTHADADVLLGTIGGGLLWSLLAPPGAVVVEFARSFGCSAGHSGWDKVPRCDYGGNARAAGQHHLTVPVPQYSTGSARRGAVAEEGSHADSGVFVPAAVWKNALRAAVCRLRSATDPCLLPDQLGYRVGWAGDNQS